MKRIVTRWLPLLAVIITGCLASRAGTPPSPPSVFALNGKVLAQKKKAVDAKDPNLVAAYKQLLQDADKALSEGPFSVMEKKHVPPSGDKHDYMSLAPYHWPDPTKADGLPYIRKDGQTNPEVKEYKDKEYMPKLCELVHTLSLAYYFSGDERYAGHAARLLRTWYLDPATRMNPNLNYAQAIKGENEGRGAGIIDARHFIKVIDAAGLLQGSKSWKAADHQVLQQWFADFLTWLQSSKNGLSEMKAPNNHGTWYDALRLSIALFTYNRAAAEAIIQSAKGRLDKQMDEGGKFPLEMARTIALHYNVFHLEAYFLIAAMAETAGTDLWHYTTPSGKSLKKGFDFLHPFLVKEKAWTGQQIKEFPYEEGYPLLLAATSRYDCRDCLDAVKHLEGDKAGRLRGLLLY